MNRNRQKREGLIGETIVRISIPSLLLAVLLGGCTTPSQQSLPEQQNVDGRVAGVNVLGRAQMNGIQRYHLCHDYPHYLGC
jgi:uncharacterized protein YceK